MASRSRSRGPKRKVVSLTASEETSRLGNPEHYRVVLACGHVRYEYHSKRLALQDATFALAKEDTLELHRYCRKCKLGWPPDYKLISIGDLDRLDPEVAQDVMDYVTNPKKKEA